MVDGHLEQRLDTSRHGLRSEQRVSSNLSQGATEPTRIHLVFCSLAGDRVVDQLGDRLEDERSARVHRHDDLRSRDHDVAQLGLIIQLVVLRISAGQHAVQQGRKRQHGCRKRQPSKSPLARHPLEPAAHQGVDQNISGVCVCAKERHNLDRGLSKSRRAMMQEVNHICCLIQRLRFISGLSQHPLVHRNPLSHVRRVANVIQRLDNCAEHVAVHDSNTALDLRLWSASGAVESTDSSCPQDLYHRLNINTDFLANRLNQAGKESLPDAANQSKRILDPGNHRGRRSILEDLLNLERAGQGDGATNKVCSRGKRSPHLQVQVVHPVDRLGDQRILNLHNNLATVGNPVEPAFIRIGRWEDHELALLVPAAVLIHDTVGGELPDPVHRHPHDVSGHVVDDVLDLAVGFKDNKIVIFQININPNFAVWLNRDQILRNWLSVDLSTHY